jgi:signal-transduction protein with cAMP-binding, CBS, and nucleotidyltransferase domain
MQIVATPKQVFLMKNANPDELLDCMNTLRLTSWFMYSPDEHLKRIALRMTRESYDAGDVIIHEGAKHEKLWIVYSGVVSRWRQVHGISHLMEEDERGGATGLFHIMNADPCYASAKCQ